MRPTNGTVDDSTPSQTSRAPDKRVQFDISPERLAALDDLMSLCGVRTRKDLFDNAMTLLEWAANETARGRKIASYKEDTDKVEVVRFPVLENAWRNRRSLESVHLVDTAGRNVKPGRPQ